MPEIAFIGDITDLDQDRMVFSWDFGDGTTAESAFRFSSHAYSAVGTYTAYAYDPNGNVSSIKVYETAVSIPADGGSQLADSVNFAGRIVIPYAPRQVVVYAGGNDLNAHKPAEMVYGDFVALMEKLQAQLPHARLAFISSAPNLKRWEQVEQVRRLNTLAAAYCRRHGIIFINVFPLMLGPDGHPRPDIFVEDGLHMNANGYAIWREAVAPHLN